MGLKGIGGFFLVIAFGIIAGSFDLAVVGPSLPGIVGEFGLGPRSVSWVFTLYALFNLVSLPLVTGLADRYGKQRIMLFSLLMMGAAALLIAFSASFAQILAGRALMGMSVSGVFPIAPALVRAHFPEGKRGSVLGMIGASFGISLFAGPLLSGFFLDWFGWRSLYISVAALALLALILALRFLDREKVDRGVQIPMGSLLFLTFSIASLALLLSGTGLGASGLMVIIPVLAGFVFALSLWLFVRKERQAVHRIFPPLIIRSSLARLILILGISTGVVQACFIFLPHYLVDSFAISDARASFLLLPLVAFFTLGNYMAGRLTDRVGPLTVLSVGWLLLGGAFSLLGFTQHLFWFYPVTLLFGLGLSTLESPSLRYMLIHIPLKAFETRAQGLLSVFISLGQLSGSAILGSLASERLAGSYQGAYAWMLVLAMGVITAIWMLRNRFKKMKITLKDGEHTK